MYDTTIVPVIATLGILTLVITGYIAHAAYAIHAIRKPAENNNIKS